VRLDTPLRGYSTSMIEPPRGGSTGKRKPLRGCSTIRVPLPIEQSASC